MWIGKFQIDCYDQDGNLKWSDSFSNNIYNEGVYLLFDVVFRNGTPPSAWYVGLMKNTLTQYPARESTLASLNVAGPFELSSGSNPGYLRKEVTRDSIGWPNLQLVEGVYEIETKKVSIDASDNWSDSARWLFLTTNGAVGDTTGKLIALAEVPQVKQLNNGERWDIIYKAQLTNR
jgi:hypothetical protein